MSADAPFEGLMRRVRAGDQEAAAELVQRYEGAVRRAVRFRLADARLRPLLDSMDICQSVFASFFIRAATGQYELATPHQLVKLLVRMAHNKLTSQARRERAERRDRRRTEAAGDAAHVPDAGPSPSQQASARELLDQVYRRLSPEERQLVELRNEGRDWNAIAAELGGTAVLLRKRLSRALDRVTRELGMEETTYD
jgi:RNA polymerase sigma-70 factor (ECF subfamily)